ncbi:MAG: hypothetical protein EOO41_04780, partial [Methanobacteriota archaeon]
MTPPPPPPMPCSSTLTASRRRAAWPRLALPLLCAALTALCAQVRPTAAVVVKLPLLRVLDEAQEADFQRAVNALAALGLNTPLHDLLDVSSVNATAQASGDGAGTEQDADAALPPPRSSSSLFSWTRLQSLAAHTLSGASDEIAPDTEHSVASVVAVLHRLATSGHAPSLLLLAQLRLFGSRHLMRAEHVRRAGPVLLDARALPLPDARRRCIASFTSTVSAVVPGIDAARMRAAQGRLTLRFDTVADAVAVLNFAACLLSMDAHALAMHAVHALRSVSAPGGVLLSATELLVQTNATYDDGTLAPRLQYELPPLAAEQPMAGAHEGDYEWQTSVDGSHAVEAEYLRFGGDAAAAHTAIGVQACRHRTW